MFNGLIFLYLYKNYRKAESNKYLFWNGLWEWNALAYVSSSNAHNLKKDF